MAALLHHLAKLDIPGGGQVVAEGDYAFVGHMHPPHGTSIVDVSDPRRPEIVGQVSLPEHTHSHKVRVHGDIMLVNNELFRATMGERPDDFAGGIRIYDIADRTKPRPIGHYRSQGSHRFDSDGAYAYISSEEEGYVGDIVVILDLRTRRGPSRSRNGGCRGNGPPAARPRPGRGAGIAVIIRCAAATGSIP